MTAAEGPSFERPDRYPSGMTSPTDTALILGATMRLTRLVTGDDLGVWWVQEPAEGWVEAHPGHPAGKYAAGLGCPACVGYWVGVGVLVSYAATRRSPAGRRVWRFVAGSLTLNLVSVTAGAQVGYWE